VIEIRVAPATFSCATNRSALRERVLEGFAFAWGKRIHADGSVDLWAELARPGH